MIQVDRENLKKWALAIVTEVEPDDAFVVEDGFDALVEEWHRADAQDEGRFIGGAEIATFAAMVAPFLLAFFGDVAKDVVKDRAKTAVGSLLDRLLDRRATKDDMESLRKDITAAINKSRFSSAEKAKLEAGFAKLFAKVGPKK